MFDAGAIVGRIKLDSTQFNSSVDQAKRKVVNLGENIRGLGVDLKRTTMQLRQASMVMTFLGAGIITPLIATFKSAEKYSNQVRKEIERLNNVFLQFRVSVAEGLIPIMHRFSNILADLYNRWIMLSPQLRESILQTTMLAGTFLLLGGILSTIALKIAQLVSLAFRMIGSFIVFAGLHPGILAVAIALTAVAWAMWKIEGFATPILNFIELQVLRIAKAIAWWRENTYGVIAAWARMTRNNDLEIWAYRQTATVKFLIEDLNKEIERIRTPGIKGRFAEGFEELKSNIEEIKNLFKDLGNAEFNIPNVLEASKTFLEGWRDSLEQTLRDLRDWGKMAGGVVQQMATGMKTIFSDLIFNIQDYFNGTKNFFVEWGNFVLKIISDVIAQIITAKIIAGIGSIFSGAGAIATTATTGASYQMAPVTMRGGLGYQEGIERVPYTGMYKLHADEQVVPKYDSGKKESIALTLYNLITPEAVAQAMASKEGEGVIVNTINQDSLRNGIIRREVIRR